MSKKPYVNAFYINIQEAATERGHILSLPDGDKVCIKSMPSKITDKHKFNITLSQPNGNWWKAITAHTPPNTFSHEIVQVHDKYHTDTKLTSFKDMVSFFVVLSKAKAFGVHVNEYWIQNSYDLTPDKDWEIIWLKS